MRPNSRFLRRIRKPTWRLARASNRRTAQPPCHMEERSLRDDIVNGAVLHAPEGRRDRAAMPPNQPCGAVTGALHTRSRRASHGQVAEIVRCSALPCGDRIGTSLVERASNIPAHLTYAAPLRIEERHFSPPAEMGTPFVRVRCPIASASLQPAGAAAPPLPASYPRRRGA
jgi:hypothetical protein